LTGDAKYRADNFLFAYAALLFQPSEKRLSQIDDYYPVSEKWLLIRDFDNLKNWVEK
jgi:hypothetical protein